MLHIITAMSLQIQIWICDYIKSWKVITGHNNSSKQNKSLALWNWKYNSITCLSSLLLLYCAVEKKMKEKQGHYTSNVSGITTRKLNCSQILMMLVMKLVKHWHWLFWRWNKPVPAVAAPLLLWNIHWHTDTGRQQQQHWSWDLVLTCILVSKCIII